jgi:phospholipid/cholesterol/gamma-HCH transport system permease protein
MTARVRQSVLAFGEAADFFWQIVRRILNGRVGQYFVEVLRQANVLASGSVFIVLVLVFAFGLTIGIQAAYGARLVGAPSAAGAFTSIGDMREIAPYAFGYMMAAKATSPRSGRCGSATRSTRSTCSGWTRSPTCAPPACSPRG